MLRRVVINIAQGTDIVTVSSNILIPPENFARKQSINEKHKILMRNLLK